VFLLTPPDAAEKQVGVFVSNTFTIIGYARPK
jgi:hypothetical protein